jgi:hypothetical protein
MKKVMIIMKGSVVFVFLTAVIVTGMWRRVVLCKFADVSENNTASICMVEELTKQPVKCKHETEWINND